LSKPSFQPRNDQMISFFSSLVGSYTITTKLSKVDELSYYPHWERTRETIPKVYTSTLENKTSGIFTLSYFEGMILVLSIEYNLNVGSKINRIMTDRKNVICDIFEVWFYDDGSLHYKCSETDTRPNIYGRIAKLSQNTGFSISNTAGENYVLDTFKFVTN
jgi:hypothetical protein